MMNNHKAFLTSLISLSDDDISEFQDLYFNEFGEKIDVRGAEVEAIRLLLTIKAIYKPIKTELDDI